MLATRSPAAENGAVLSFHVKNIHDDPTTHTGSGQILGLQHARGGSYFRTINVEVATRRKGTICRQLEAVTAAAIDSDVLEPGSDRCLPTPRLACRVWTESEADTRIHTTSITFSTTMLRRQFACVAKSCNLWVDLFYQVAEKSATFRLMARIFSDTASTM